MGGIGSGRTVGSKKTKKGYPRVAPFSEAIKIDVWQLYRDGLLAGGSAVYEVKHKGEAVEVRVRNSGLGVCINGVEVAIACGDLPRDATARRLKVKYKLECPRCGETRCHLYIYDGNLGCKSCLGLYTPGHGKKHRVEQSIPNYAAMKAEVEKLAAIWEAYLRQGQGVCRPTWTPYGSYHRPSRFKQRLDNLQHQLRLCELSLWQRAS